MSEAMAIGKGTREVALLPRMLNRHGLIAGATGTGKTVTLQTIAGALSDAGIPVFVADVKGDLAGISRPGAMSDRLAGRLSQLGVADFAFRGYPVAFWDLFKEQGHPVRATISDMGPLLLGRLLNLNDIQSGVLTMVFQIADDSGLLLLDLKDLRALLQHVAENAGTYTARYGNVSKATVGTIQRGLLELERQGAEQFFGEPMLNVFDLIRTGEQGRGIVNVLASDRLFGAPKVYAVFLLWLLSELFEQLPEVGDLDKPKLVFFFDEAHLLFEDVPDALLEKIEQVVRLIRSKGVAVFFVTQNPLDIPPKIAGQLGNRVQHALRAFTKADQQAVRAAADTFRPNPAFDAGQAITELAVGEALVSFLEENGNPAVVERAMVAPPRSRIGPITPDERQETIRQSFLFGRYDAAVDRESAYEQLKAKAEQAAPAAGEPPSARPGPAGARPAGRQPENLITAMAKSAVRAIGTQVGRQIIRGILGSMTGGTARASTTGRYASRSRSARTRG